ncbi:BZ3500_MvSof-1268-A1-R1_Chr5-2g07815 [Microbotryum saponariae]|uniref:BZ3500_MvSof-1268-A1-R1_Chr5-2g07815 protein n=1 Tax=Microbotryum saponariae TaxID=289078 RepID=A0A2X0L9H8_9BASI|nr:BZ3500_MvSof-1268-A1-R1_Chr5-2g07815 [Microbotryum saponariae]SDA05684.1 BZ3501_MvSof-1269-A2-R1_Chr5-2g07637 [Microbotryum saponariae]
MLASFASGTSDFFQKRRRGLTWVVGTIGGAYLVGQWGMKKMGEFAERQRKEGIEKDKLSYILSKRFNLNLQDSQFTVLALLPTVARQVLDEYDVDACWKGLRTIADRAKQDSERKQREEQERNETEKRKVEGTWAEVVKGDEGKEESSTVGESEEQHKANGTWAEVVKEANNGEAAAADGIQAKSGLVDVEDKAPETWAEAVKGHAAGQATAGGSGTAAEAYTVGQTQQNASTSGELAQEPQPASASSETVAPTAETTHTDNGMGESTAGLSKSWAQVVVNGEGQPVEKDQENPTTFSEIVGVAEAEPKLPLRTRAELWNDIKLLSFTRTITSIYVLTLMTLQTHVQLSLLGRSAYVASVVSTLSVPSALDKAEDDIVVEFNTDRDLEMALYGEKAQTSDQVVGVSKDTERKYLTFSWWLLHEGWRLVGDRVQRAVNKVVGPMGLKSPIVYGELSTLLDQIRNQIETDEDGTMFDFSAVLFPSSLEDEVKTLTAGGIPTISATINPELRRLLSETHDCLDSSDGQLVRQRLLDAMFTRLVLGLEAPFQSPVASMGQGSRFEDVTERSTILAKLLPVLAQHSHNVLSGMSNEYVEAMEDVRELREFSAIIYASFDRENVRETC